MLEYQYNIKTNFQTSENQSLSSQSHSFIFYRFVPEWGHGDVTNGGKLT